MHSPTPGTKGDRFPQTTSLSPAPGGLQPGGVPLALPAAPGVGGPRRAYLAAEHLQRIRVTNQPEAPAPRPALLAQIEEDDGGQRRVGQPLRLRVAAARLPVPRPRAAPGPGQVIKADESLGSARLRLLLGCSWSILVHPPAGSPGGAGATRGEPGGGHLEGRGHGGAGGLGVAAGRLQRRGGMAGQAAASPPAEARPPPSPCPAVCGLRSSSSPCLRGPEPGERRTGRGEAAGRPPLPVLAPTLGSGRLSGSTGPLRTPTSARGRGCCPVPRGRAAEDAPTGGRAEPSAPHSWIPHSNFKSRLLLPPLPMGARPRPFRASPLGAAGVRPGSTAGRAGSVPRRGGGGAGRGALA